MVLPTRKKQIHSPPVSFEFLREYYMQLRVRLYRLMEILCHRERGGVIVVDVAWVRASPWCGVFEQDSWRNHHVQSEGGWMRIYLRVEGWGWYSLWVYLRHQYFVHFSLQQFVLDRDFLEGSFSISVITRLLDAHHRKISGDLVLGGNLMREGVIPRGDRSVWRWDDSRSRVRIRDHWIQGSSPLYEVLFHPGEYFLSSRIDPEVMESLRPAIVSLFRRDEGVVYPLISVTLIWEEHALNLFFSQNRFLRSSKSRSPVPGVYLSVDNSHCRRQPEPVMSFLHDRGVSLRRFYVLRQHSSLRKDIKQPVAIDLREHIPEKTQWDPLKKVVLSHVRPVSQYLSWSDGASQIQYTQKLWR